MSRTQKGAKCHPPAVRQMPQTPQANSLDGSALPSERADRVQAPAPPVMPHPALLREKCLACHAPDGWEDVTSTFHPERLRCRQCPIQQSTTAGRFPK
jgi:hypothetical protein